MTAHLSSLPSDVVLGAALPDKPGLIALGLVAALVLVSIWRILLRLVVVALLALAFVGLIVVASPQPAPAIEPSPTTGAPREPTPGHPTSSPTTPDPQRAQGGS